ncbi:hypothetical protein BKA62DRAFT_52250 [Auriculariales sp. MPI-PUGE-AT-0066]|nr:hypothetical protein BKA62DRAFT_52250 [Auriculariales sp. MPI-PUGE-AT-0066]
MMASGPFAMGPAPAAGRSRGPTVRAGPSLAATAQSALVPQLPAIPTIKHERRLDQEDEDEEAYSDPDPGVEIVDLADVRRMDYNAPETIRKESKIRPRIKFEDDNVEYLGSGVSIPQDDPLVADFDDSEELSDLIRALTGKQFGLEIEPRRKNFSSSNFLDLFPNSSLLRRLSQQLLPLPRLRPILWTLMLRLRPHLCHPR